MLHDDVNDEDPYTALLEYRNTLLDGVGISPAQLLSPGWSRYLSNYQVLDGVGISPATNGKKAEDKRF